jgi:acyl-CoA dehydrogenase
MAWNKELGDFLAEHREKSLAPFVGPLKKGLDDLQAATMWFVTERMMKPDNAGAGATDYMHLFGLVALGHMWARIAVKRRMRGSRRTIRMRSDEGRADAGPHHFMERMAMPETALRRARIEAGV